MKLKVFLDDGSHFFLLIHIKFFENAVLRSRIVGRAISSQLTMWGKNRFSFGKKCISAERELRRSSHL
jgi:hypothetical protein